jgi:hypothetical protein
VDDLDSVIALIPVAYQVWLFKVILILTVLLPAIEKIIELTPNKSDDAFLARVLKVLAVLPRVRIPALQKAKLVAAPVSVTIAPVAIPVVSPESMPDAQAVAPITHPPAA